ncbi:MAG TPA: twin-arginine translocation signal domain-containing protein, partial [Gemmatimonadales bacterium]|nr:twin-arginine translocation signal domain-containing protein [Gemmatimonadales bacterium]
MSQKPDFNRRQFVGAAAATVAAGSLGVFGFSRRVEAMTQVLTDVGQPTGSDGTDIRPFRFKAADADLTDLRRRVNATKWPEREWTPDSSDG